MLLKADWASRMGFNKSVHMIREIAKAVCRHFLISADLSSKSIFQQGNDLTSLL